MKTNALRAVVLGLIALVASLGVYAQSVTVKGRVTDASDGTPVPGCTVTVKGTANGVTTDVNGDYFLTTRKGAVLLFSCIGYQAREVKVTGVTLNIALTPDAWALNEMSVIRTKELTTRQNKPERETVAKLAVVADMAFQESSCYISGEPYRVPMQSPRNTEEYNSITENRFKQVAEEPLSTFSVDVDAASYSNMRRFVNRGELPPADAVRVEELINYFSYNYAEPTGNDPVKISAEVGDCPWNNSHRLVRIALKGKEIAGADMPASNLVFLVDVSGSMYGPTRLELVKSSLKLLVNNLREKDRVAIVVYAGSAGEVLPSTSGSDKQKIREALDQLTAGGSTAGGAGIKLAYQIARKNYIANGNNRIILCTDGDFNVGISSTQELEKLVENERKSGVFLTVLGYGMGNYKDNRMQVLAEKGNGNYAYIDNLQEANKTLVNEFGGTIYTIAKDVKLQIEFNPAQVSAYRLVGYESRLLNKEDFNDDTKDAGEMGAGHTVTAFYEIIPVGVESKFTGYVDALKYQKAETIAKPAYTNSKELLTIKLRYKQPDKDVSKKIELPLVDNKGNYVSSDFRFAASVAMFGQLLRNSDYKGDATYDKVITLARTSLDNDRQGYRREFVRLVEAVMGLTR